MTTFDPPLNDAPAPNPSHRPATLHPAEEKTMTALHAVLDDTDREITEFIRSCVATRGYPPSVREIGEMVGMTSTSSVHHRLRKLQREGVIRRADNRSRAITLVDECPAA